MSAQVEVWKKEQISSAQSFAQNLAAEIKTIELKLDKLVNAFLDGTVERETYLQKKDELIKAKMALQQKKSDFGQKAKFWIEPLREWIKTSKQAGKLASSEDFYQIKSLVEKIGTNRRLLDKKICLNFKKPFDLIPKYKSSYEKRIGQAPPVGGISLDAGILRCSKIYSKSSLFQPKNPENLIWSGEWDLYAISGEAGAMPEAYYYIRIIH